MVDDDGVVDAERVALLLFEFMRKHQAAMMAAALDSVALDFSKDSIADELCLRIADDPELLLDAEPIELRALVGTRIMVCLANAISMPDDTVALEAPGAIDDLVATAGIFGRLLSTMRLPAEWNGKPYGKARQ